MKLLNTGVPLIEETICNFEIELSLVLPQDYKNFMLKNNGGIPDGNWTFDFFDIGNSRKDTSSIQYFEKVYTQDSAEDDDIRASYKALVETEQIPKSLLPIADDPFGNIIFICISGEDTGKVLFGDHEIEAAETGYLVVSPIANSFSEFLDKLYLCE